MAHQPDDVRDVVLIGAGGVTLFLSVTLALTLSAFAAALWLRARGI